MIFCFSGTGNSLLVARELARHLGHGIVMLEKDTLLRPKERLYELGEGEDALWVFPIYSWGVPPVVRRFMRKVKLKTPASTLHWMVATCGDDIGGARKSGAGDGLPGAPSPWRCPTPTSA